MNPVFHFFVFRLSKALPPTPFINPCLPNQKVACPFFPRKLALERLDEENASRWRELKEEIEALLHDPHMEVKRAAMNILKKMR